jgi:carbon-monoxide dehydrogenase large subunit
MGYFGRRQVRVEDDLLVTGRGQYVDDLTLPGMLHVALLRSTMAHARLRAVDVSRARAAKGVVAVFTVEDLPPAARWLADCHAHPALTPKELPTLATDKVRYVGEPIAAVVADSRYLAEDAAELIEVDYDALPAVVDLEKAMEAGAPLVHDDRPNNIAARLPINKGDTARAFAQAPCVVKERLEIHRGAGQAMETRGIVASWNAADQRLTVWNVSQVPFLQRSVIAGALGVPEYRVRVLNGEVGGGFGYKGLVYVEDILIPFIAWKIGRPVKWIEDRHEHLIAAYHERSQLHDIEMATDARGVILGVRGRFLADNGAYTPWGPVVPLLTLVNIPGPYKVPTYTMEAIIVFTTCVPVAPVRGAGRPQAVYVMERLLDRVAERLAIDPAEVRQRNLIQPEDYPYDVGFISRDGSRRTYDSGNVPALLRRAMEIVQYDERRREQAEQRRRGRYIGLGVGCCVEEAGLGPYEEVSVSVERTGKVIVRTGAPAQGQGHRTTFAQIVADELTVPLEDVTVVSGDTDLVRYSIGTFASRAAVLVGSAALQASREVRDRALRIAATMLEASEPDLLLEHGRVTVKGAPARGVTLAEIARRSLGEAGVPLRLASGPGLGAISAFCPPATTYPTGAHAAVVEVDPKTAEIRILKYAAVQDFGTLMNPLIVDGQVIGGVAHGIGNTFFERVVYADDGQILTGTLMDYLMPTAADVPRIDVDYLGTPSPLNPLGAKGAGQGGLIPVAAVLTAAVEDALRPFGVKLTHVPFTPSDLVEAIEAGTAATERRPRS